MTHRHASTNCQICGHILDSSTNLDGERTPKKGDVTLCIECAAVYEFEENAKMRLLTSGDISAFKKTDYNFYLTIMAAINAIHFRNFNTIKRN